MRPAGEAGAGGCALSRLCLRWTIGVRKRRLLWATPLVLLVHPAPYFLVGTIVIAVLTARGRISGGWVWLLVGFCAYAAFMAMMLLKVRKRARSARNV